MVCNVGAGAWGAVQTYFIVCNVCGCCGVCNVCEGAWGFVKSMFYRLQCVWVSGKRGGNVSTGMCEIMCWCVCSWPEELLFRAKLMRVSGFLSLCVSGFLPVCCCWGG